MADSSYLFYINKMSINYMKPSKISRNYVHVLKAKAGRCAKMNYVVGWRGM